MIIHHFSTNLLHIVWTSDKQHCTYYRPISYLSL